MTSTWRWSGAHRFEHEAQPEHVAEGGHETRPQQAELEAEDRTRDDADREQREHHLRPAPRERAEERVAGAQVAPLCEQNHRRKRDAEADERDVHRERERLHLPSLEQVVLVDWREHAEIPWMNLSKRVPCQRRAAFPTCLPRGATRSPRGRGFRRRERNGRGVWGYCRAVGTRADMSTRFRPSSRR